MTKTTGYPAGFIRMESARCFKAGHKKTAALQKATLRLYEIKFDFPKVRA